MCESEGEEERASELIRGASVTKVREDLTISTTERDCPKVRRLKGDLHLVCNNRIHRDEWASLAKGRTWPPVRQMVIYSWANALRVRVGAVCLCPQLPLSHHHNHSSYQPGD